MAASLVQTSANTSTSPTSSFLLTTPGAAVAGDYVVGVCTWQNASPLTWTLPTAGMTQFAAFTYGQLQTVVFGGLIASTPQPTVGLNLSGSCLHGGLSVVIFRLSAATQRWGTPSLVQSAGAFESSATSGKFIGNLLDVHPPTPPPAYVYQTYFGGHSATNQFPVSLPGTMTSQAGASGGYQRVSAGTASANTMNFTTQCLTDTGAAYWSSALIQLPELGPLPVREAPGGTYRASRVYVANGKRR